MTAKNMLRVVTPDTAHAVDIACSDVGSAIGLPVRAEFQEIEGDSLIIELQLGGEARTSRPTRHDWRPPSTRPWPTWKFSARGKNRRYPNHLLVDVPTCWGWATNLCPKLPSALWMMTFRQPSGTALTRHGIWQFRLPVAANRSLECRIGADIAADSQRTMLPRSGRASRHSPTAWA